jgi:hypothetical protein
MPFAVDQKGRCFSDSPAASIATATPVAITASSTIAASSAIAAAEVDRIARKIQSTMVATDPMRKAPAVAAAKITAVRSEAIARRSSIGAAVRQSGHQQVADQRCRADRNCKCRHCARHSFSRLKIGLCGATIPWDNAYWSRNVAGPFIDHSSEMWNFRRWNASSAVLAP